MSIVESVSKDILKSVHCEIRYCLKYQISVFKRTSPLTNHYNFSKSDTKISKLNFIQMHKPP